MIWSIMKNIKYLDLNKSIFTSKKDFMIEDDIFSAFKKIGLNESNFELFIKNQKNMETQEGELNKKEENIKLLNDKLQEKEEQLKTLQNQLKTSGVQAEQITQLETEKENIQNEKKELEKEIKEKQQEL